LTQSFVIFDSQFAFVRVGLFTFSHFPFSTP
jgi:hypothetical protein